MKRKKSTSNRLMSPLNPVEFIEGLHGLLDEKVYIPESLRDNPVLQVLLRRRSVRNFEDKEIPDEVMQVIIEAARLAPSAVNMQPWTFGIFDRAAWKDVFDREIPFKGNKAIIIMGDVSRVRLALEDFPFKPLTEYTLGVLNGGIAAYAINIAAEACGVCSVMLSDTGKTGFYDAEYLIEKLELPEGVFPLTTIVLGYPKGNTLGMPPKYPAEEITFIRKYKPPNPTNAQSWLKKMKAGYRATYITRSFSWQLRHYFSKIDAAERGLHNIIFYKQEEFKESL